VILRRSAVLLLMLVVLLPQAPPAAAHAILVTSAPAAKSTVAGPNVTIDLHFNVRVDGTRSRITLLLPSADAKPLALTIMKQVSPETLSSQAAGLKPGEYTIRWQVLAADGHITRGMVPFTIRAS
jgi:methionine-rich copper-binding protein CopC